MTNLTCKDLMLQEQVTLHPTDTVSKAFKLMRNNGMRFLPVVDDDGKYVGVFTSPTLIRLMLPRAVTLDMSGKESQMGDLTNLSFISLTKENFISSLSEVKNDLVKNHLSNPENIPVAAPETPLMEGIYLLHAHKRHVILVEPDTNQFIGVLTINSTLQQIFDENVEL